MRAVVRHRMFWAVAAAIMAALILIATLTPSPGTPTTPNIWCIACDELGALDVVANTVMFLPLGLTLALATGRRWATVVACAVLTLAIELLQVRVVIGRDASVSDLMANTLGGWIGAELALAGLHLLRPSDAVASRLTVAAAVLFALVCTLTSAGLRPAVVPPPLWIQLTPPRASFAPFSGRVLEFDVNGLPLNTRFPPGTRELERVLRGAEWRATVAIGTDGLEARRSVIVRVAEEFTVLVSVEQWGRDLVCYQKTRSSDFKFRSPKVAAANAFDPLLPPTAQPIEGGSARLTCVRTPGALAAGINGTEERARLSPSLGWLLLSPFDLTITARRFWISLAWLFALSFPVGYWAGQRREPVRGRWALTSAAAAGLFVAGLTLAPQLAGISAANGAEWAAALAGVAAGALIGRAVSRTRGHLLPERPADRIRA